MSDSAITVERQAPPHAKEWEDFRRAFPIEGWEPSVEATLTAFENGARACIMSGRQGTGKTQHYSEQVLRRIDSGVLGIDEIESNDPAPIETMQSAVSLLSEPGELIMLDEGGALLANPNGGEAAAELLFEAAKDRNPTLIKIPGATHQLRQEIKQRYIEIARRHLPGDAIVDIGDIAQTYINFRQAVGLIATTGTVEGFTDLLEATPALRNPRVFNTVFNILGNKTSRAELGIEQYDPEGAVQIVRDMTTFDPDNLDSRPIALLKNWPGDVGIGEGSNEFKIVEHELFLNSSVSTVEAIALYRLAGTPLPGPDVFNVDEIGFDPYFKN